MKLQSLSKIISQLEKLIVAFGILGIAGFTIANVVCRTFFGFSIGMAEEISQILILAVTFIGTSHAVTSGRHIRMSAIYDMLPAKPRKALMMFICLVTSLISGALVYWSMGYIEVLATLESRTPVLGWPMYMVYLSFPIGLGLTAMKYFLAFIKNIVSDGIYLSVQEKEHSHEVVS